MSVFNRPNHTMSSRFLSLLTLIALAAPAARAQTVAPATPPLSDEAIVKLEKFLVVGQPIEGYRATDALTGTKTGADLRDLPLSLAVVPRELIEDRRLTYLGEALDNVSGAQRKLGYGGTQNFGAIIRGFDSGFITLRNGFRDFGFYTLREGRREASAGPHRLRHQARAGGGAPFPWGPLHCGASGAPRRGLHRPGLARSAAPPGAPDLIRKS
ncbi:MAG: Plug domain-containing protein [Opitutaceae bacterium]|nr:Plug domain-containing protein [Opitutaceae bacterium]